MAEQRTAVAEYLLGDISVDPFKRFAQAVDLLVGAPVGAPASAPVGAADDAPVGRAGELTVDR